MNEIGRKIKALRTQKGWTQEFLADKLGLTRFAIANWEVGRRTPPTDILNQIADAFDVGVDFLLGRKDYKNTVADFLARAEDIFSDTNTTREDCEDIMDGVMRIYISIKSTKERKQNANKEEEALISIPYKRY